MRNIRSPRFFSAGPLPKHDALPRPDFESEILSVFKERGRLRLEGPRRVGKTSLVLNALSDVAAYVVTLDFYNVRSEARVLDIVGDAFLGLLRVCPPARRMYGAKAGNEASGSLGIPKIAQIAMKWSEADGTQPYPSTLGGFLDAFNHIGETIPLAVFFDEVQSLFDIPNAPEIIGRLRGVTQHHRNVAYFFAGSVRHLMHRMFDAPDAPFFKQIASLPVPPIPMDLMRRYIEIRLRPLKATDDVWPLVQTITDGIPGDIQYLFAHVWSAAQYRPSLRTITPNEINAGLAKLFESDRVHYLDQIGRLSHQQLTLLTALCRYTNIPIYSFDMQKAVGFSSGSIRTALSALEKAGLIFECAPRSYAVENPFFRAFIASGRHNSPLLQIPGSNSQNIFTRFRP